MTFPKTSISAFLLGLMLTLVGCGPVPKPPTPQPPVETRTLVVTVRTPSGTIVQSGSASLSDDFNHEVSCQWGGDRLTCLPGDIKPGWQSYLKIAEVPDTLSYSRTFILPFETTVDLGEIHLDPVKPPMPPVGSKESFVANYQGNFGGIKVPGCGLHMDSLFDPFLLERFVNNRGCYEQMMQAHAVRNDNVVVVSGSSGYAGQNLLDAWHNPALVVEFLTDIRSRQNAKGEFFRVQFVTMSHAGSPRDPKEFEHWKRDMDGIAAVTQDLVDATMTCWECRHVNDWTSAKLYIDMGRYVAAKWPKAFHGQHLVSNSSSWSSWPCDPQQPGSCTNPGDGPPADDADDPNRGNELSAWWNCLREGWCDGFYYQFDIGRSYLYPSPGDDAMERWVEIVERLGDDPWSLATSKGNRHGWPQVPVIAFEFIYDTYWNRDPKATEAYQIEWCKRALALGGRGCGSASTRR